MLSKLPLLYTYSMLIFWQRTLLRCIAIASAVIVVTADTVQAQQLEGIAEYLPITDSGVKDGDIVTFVDNAYRRAKIPYDPHLIGVVNLEPAIALNVVGPEGTYAVVTKHTVHVNVSSSNGPINAGDFITSSDRAGNGMKATKAGTVLGIALASFKPQEANTIGQIPVEINITYAVPKEAEPPSQARSIVSQLLRLLTTGAEAAATEPNTALRYIVAALVLLLSITFGFLAFGRSAANGIIAIGRNPLARRSILLGVSFNILMTVAFVAAGLVLGFLILAA